MWIDLSDGWRDESSEGPYTSFLHTYYDWKSKVEYKITRSTGLGGDSIYTLSSRDKKVWKRFKTVKEAKDYVSSLL